MKGVDVSSYIDLLTSPFCNPFKSMQNGSQKPECCGFSPAEFLLNLVKTRINPPRLIYDIWSRAKELKRGTKVDNKEIESRFRRFKEKTRGTDKEFLFNSMARLDSIRQLS